MSPFLCLFTFLLGARGHPRVDEAHAGGHSRALPQHAPLDYRAVADHSVAREHRSAHPSAGAHPRTLMQHGVIDLRIGADSCFQFQDLQKSRVPPTRDPTLYFF